MFGQVAKSDYSQGVALKQGIAFGLKLAVTAGCFFWVARSVNFHKVMPSLTGLPLPGLALLIAFMTGLGWLQAWRWRLILSQLGIQVPFQRVLRPVLISIGIMQVVPGTVGADAYRVAHLGGTHGAMRDVLVSCIFDRVCAALALVALALVGLPMFAAQTGAGRLAVVVLVCAALIPIGIAGVSIIAAKIPDVPTGHWISQPLAFIRSFGKLARNMRLTLAALALSLMIHMGLIAVVFTLFYMLGRHVELIACLSIMAPVLLISMLPISIAGWGIRDGLMLGAFSLLGVDNTSILTASLLFGALSAASGLASLLAGLFQPGMISAPSAGSKSLEA